MSNATADDAFNETSNNNNGFDDDNIDTFSTLAGYSRLLIAVCVVAGLILLDFCCEKRCFLKWVRELNDNALESNVNTGVKDDDDDDDDKSTESTAEEIIASDDPSVDPDDGARTIVEIQQRIDKLRDQRNKIEEWYHDKKEEYRGGDENQPKKIHWEDDLEQMEEGGGDIEVG